MDHFQYHRGLLHAEDVPLDEIADSVGTPFYCYSTATLTRHYRVFADAFSTHRAKLCYAVKANSNLALLKTLAKLGAGADVVSQGEIRLALAAGIAPRDIVFSGVGKTREEMAYALSQDIFQFNIESAAELQALNEVAQNLKQKARIAIRVNPDVDARTHAKISTGKKTNKFGVDIEDAPALFHEANKLPGIDVQGISVHIGSQLSHLSPLKDAFIAVRDLANALRKQGIPLRILDLGGGLGIPYGNIDPPPLPAAYAEMVKEVVKDQDFELMFEPGRVIVGNAGVLVTRVIYLKRNAERVFVIVDAGMNDLIRPTLYTAFHEIVPIKQPDGNAATELVDVVGPVCESSDIFAEQRLLKLPEPGDLLAFRSAGAYGAAMACEYNARPLVPEVLVSGERYGLTRARPSYEEMLKQYRMPDWLK